MPNTPRDTESRYRTLARNHAVAFAHPYPGFEQSITQLVNGLVGYAHAYQARYQVPVSADPSLAYDWLKIAQGLANLLDGETGRFDCPTLDGLIRTTAQQAGYTMSLELIPGDDA